MPETRTSHDAARTPGCSHSAARRKPCKPSRAGSRRPPCPTATFLDPGWQASRPRILQRIRDQFQGAKLAVRSSALIEDGANESMAGAFLSLQHVNGASPGDVTDAITRVMQSMTGNPQDQVLVQPMIEDIAVNGVIMTYDMVHGTPYYCIDFDDERQDRHHHRRQRHQQGAFRLPSRRTWLAALSPHSALPAIGERTGIPVRMPRTGHRIRPGSHGKTLSVPSPPDG